MLGDWDVKATKILRDSVRSTRFCANRGRATMLEIRIVWRFCSVSAIFFLFPRGTFL